MGPLKTTAEGGNEKKNELVVVYLDITIVPFTVVLKKNSFLDFLKV